MDRILGSTEKSITEAQQLLEMKMPVYRQAYSDRTAWIMACLSELAYLRFNPLFSNDDVKGYLIDNVSELIGEGKKKSLLKVIDLFSYDHVEELQVLERELKGLEFEIVATYDCMGTQAVLVKNQKFLALAFRGTEATSIKDIKADAKAYTTRCETGGRIHSGFNEAYDSVALDIQERLSADDLKEYPLFITGHSLGGALATIAAKKLNHQGGIAACYTFGAPRVGDEQWISNFKTPIYRLVNAADCVTMLPPGDEVVSSIGWAIQIVPWVGKSIRKWLLANLDGYLHGGNMRYLTNCKKGTYSQVRLLYSVSFWYRMKGFIIKKLPWKKFLSDHSISVYRKKLWEIAQRNNIIK
ncbi:MAG: lipase family protein [Carboxylicivirga sp.]|jgi:pimeloyl-ACP methyl ester carboxylesterase|nr:lipase family protein [Carboxylicivirga sp.]